MKTLYLDMDGVVADFDELATRILGTAAAPNGIYPDEQWNKIAEHKRLYLDLNKTVYADQLVTECKDFTLTKGYRLCFLTAVPKGNDIKWAFYDKVIWAQQHWPGIPVMFGPYSKDKWQHCSPSDILIDDRLCNIEEWRVAGGIAIHHTNIDATLYELSRLY